MIPLPGSFGIQTKICQLKQRLVTKQDLKIIAMIPARYAASRFPGKLMQDLKGKTVIRRTYEAAVETNLFEEVFVVTDSEIIQKEIESFHGKAIMSRKEHECG